MYRILININTSVMPSHQKGEGYISGVGRSTQCLIDAFAKLNQSDLVIETSLEGIAYSGVHPYGNLPNHKILLPYKLIPLYRKLLNYDLYHYPNNYYARTYNSENYVLTIHDVIQYRRAVKEGRTREIQYILKNVDKASGIVTCSTYSKNQIIESFSCDPQKVFVAPWGIDTQKFHPLDESNSSVLLKKKNISGKYFLSVSCKDDRKNIPNLLEAYRIYAQERSCPLLLLWDNPPQKILQKYDKEISEKKIRFLEYVDDKMLVALYNNAQCTFFPSREEGFGFPILESFACGTPVVTCKNSSLCEVGGDLAYYVGEDDLYGMARMMKMVENIDKSVFREAFRKHILQFSWENTALKYLEFYLKYL